MVQSKADADGLAWTKKSSKTNAFSGDDNTNFESIIEINEETTDDMIANELIKYTGVNINAWNKRNEILSMSGERPRYINPLGDGVQY